MKTSFTSTLLRTGVVCLFAVTTICSAKEIKDPRALTVQVNIPAAWNPIVTDRIADDFVDAMRTLLEARGYTGAVESLGYVEDAERVPYLLTINLIEWRMRRTGLIDCTLTASLQTPRGKRELGLYQHSSLHLAGTGRFLLDRDFDEAASGALDRLCRDILRTELLPDTRLPVS